jgi:hypothetical protein
MFPREQIRNYHIAIDGIFDRSIRRNSCTAGKVVQRAARGKAPINGPVYIALTQVTEAIDEVCVASGRNREHFCASSTTPVWAVDRPRRKVSVYGLGSELHDLAERKLEDDLTGFVEDLEMAPSACASTEA